MKKIVNYFITMFQGWDKYGTKGSRCVGYFPKYSEAREEVINNALDIYEDGYYPYAVIEAVEPGIYSICEVPIFFKFNKETKKYEPIECPEELRIFRGFGIG